MVFLPSRGSRTGSTFSGRFSIRTVSPQVRACSITSRYLQKVSESKQFFFCPETAQCDNKHQIDCSPSYPLCPSCTTLSSGPRRFRIHLMPCCCGSMMSGQRSLVVRMAAFSVDILSFGRPWLCQAATVASSVSMRTGSRPSVRGTETWNGKPEWCHQTWRTMSFSLWPLLPVCR